MARGLYVADAIGPVDVTSRPAFNTFTTFADVMGNPQRVLPKMRMEVGLIMELWAGGLFGTTGTPTCSVGFYINGAPSTAPTTLVAPTTILAQTQLAVTGGTTQVTAPWSAYMKAQLRATGAGAAGGSWRIIDGWAKIASTTTPFNVKVEWNMPVTEALRTVTFDCTADRAVGVGWAWGTSSASNTVTVDEFELRCIT
jgi:hypothetical protein